MQAFFMTVFYWRRMKGQKKDRQPDRLTGRVQSEESPSSHRDVDFKKRHKSKINFFIKPGSPGCLSAIYL